MSHISEKFFEPISYIYIDIYIFICMYIPNKIIVRNLHKLAHQFASCYRTNGRVLYKFLIWIKKKLRWFFCSMYWSLTWKYFVLVSVSLAISEKNWMIYFKIETESRMKLQSELKKYKTIILAFDLRYSVKKNKKQSYLKI